MCCKKKKEALSYGKEQKVIRLRPHHGMCLAFFEGKGYSEEFSIHMGQMLKILEKGSPVRLVLSDDDICKACPNLKNHNCITEEWVARYDQAVLELCGLCENKVMDSAVFFSRVEERILENEKRKEICGDCEWNYICENRESLWNKKKGQPD